MTNKIKYGIIENVNIIHESMLEIAMRQEVGLRLNMRDWCNGSHDRLKICCRKAYGFDFHIPHHGLKTIKLHAVVSDDIAIHDSLRLTRRK